MDCRSIRWTLDNPDVVLPDEPIGTTTNVELEVQFRNDYQQFWLQRDISCVVECRKKVYDSFPVIYLVERGFSTVAHAFTKKKNRLEVTGREDFMSNLI